MPSGISLNKQLEVLLINTPRQFYSLFAASLCASIFILYVTSCDVQADTLIIHGVSKHIGEGDFNQRNPGIGYGYDYTRYLQLRGGVYYNSFNKTSAYLSGLIHTSYKYPISIGLQIGGVSGYKGTMVTDKYTIVGIVHPVISIGNEYVRGEIGYIPTRRVQVVTFSMGVHF